MLAILFSLLLILIWILMGLSLFTIMRFHSNYHLRLLLAPAFGLSVNIVALFTLSRIGFPIQSVAMPLFVVEILLAGYFLLTQRIIWKRRLFSLFLFFIALAIFPFVWPFFKFGFEWLAFVNGDMSYYSLSSSRFLNYGYSELPISGNIYDDSDHSLAYWFFANQIGHRSGADLLLAHIVGISGLTAHQVYMPLIIASHVCVVVGAGALALLGSRKWSSALLAMVLVALSPLLTLEVTMQLLAQTIGLAFLTGLCVSYVKGMESNQIYTWAGITIMLFSGLAIAYSELVPFFGLFVLIAEATRWKKWINVKTRTVYLRTIVILALGVMLILNSYLIDLVNFIVLATGGSFKSAAMTIQGDGLSLFPHFFLPSSGALLWGWMPLSGGQASSLVIMLGLVSTLVFAGAAIISSIRVISSAQMSIIMLVIAVSMYIGGNGFGLFKIAMFIQPFLLATCVVLSTLFLTQHLFQRFGLAFLGLSFIPAQLTNIVQVSDEIGQSRVPYASTAQLGKQLRELGGTARLMSNMKIYSDTPSRELFLLQSYYLNGIQFSAAALPSTSEFLAEKFSGDLNKNDVLKTIGAVVKEQEFHFDSSDTGIIAKFKASRYDYLKTEYLIISSKEFSSINRYILPSGKRFNLRPISDQKNHLVFKQTSLGTSYVGKRSLAQSGVSLWGIEPDPLFIGQTMASVGRYHLYEILGSIEESRMLLSLSASMNRNDDFRLPPVKVVGSAYTALPLVGRGSARVVSVPINPRKIDGSDYFGIDFGREGSFLEQERKGIMKLFGSDIKLDIRKTVAFARDISYISPEQYAAFKRPQAIQIFPVALENPGLEYSGIFEDGWISNMAYVVLEAPLTGQQGNLRLSGLIPDIGGVPFSTTLTIKVNGRSIHSAIYTKGEITIMLPLDTALLEGSPSVKVEIESSALQRLPNGDDRPVSMRINYLGF